MNDPLGIVLILFRRYNDVRDFAGVMRSTDWQNSKGPHPRLSKQKWPVGETGHFASGGVWRKCYKPSVRATLMRPLP
jgi:hypothetical protein